MNKMVEETVKNMMQPGERNGEDSSEKTGSCIVDNAMNRRRLISSRRKSEF